MADQTGRTVVDAEEMVRANTMWANFGVLLKWSTIAVIVLLLLMAAFLL